MFKSKWLWMFVIVTFLAGTSIDLYAKGGGGGGGRSGGFSGGGKSFSVSSSSKSSSFSSSSKSSSSKPSSGFFGGSSKSVNISKSQSAASKPATYGKSMYSSVPAGVIPKQGFGGTSVFDKSAASQVRSNAAVQAKNAAIADTKKFTKPAPIIDVNKYKTNKVIASVKVPVGGYTKYKYDRNRYYTSRNWRTPNYAYYGQPYYGAYDGMFLWMMLDSVSDAAMMSMYFNHMNDDGIKQWRADADKLAAENAELKAKLDALDAKVSSMPGTPDPNYVDPTIPATVILASEVLDAAPKDTIPVTIMTGASTGNYSAYAQFLKRDGEAFKIEEVQEQSLVKKLEAFEAGKADMIIGPADGINVLTDSKKTLYKELVASSAPLYKEATLLLTNRHGNISSMADINESTIVIAGAEGSGTDIEWRKIARLNADYSRANIVNMSYADAKVVLSEVKNSKNLVLFYVGGLNSEFITTAEKMADAFDLCFVSMDNDEIGTIMNADGTAPLYTPAVVPEGKYPNLQRSSMMWGLVDTQKDIITYTVDATIMVHNNWVTKNGQAALDEFTATMLGIQPFIERRVNGLEL